MKVMYVSGKVTQQLANDIRLAYTSNNPIIVPSGCNITFAYFGRHRA